MLLALVLVLAAQDASGASAAKIVEVSGDIEVTITWGAGDVVTDKGAADIKVNGERITIGAASAGKGEAKVSLGAQKLEEIIAKGGARVTLTGFAGKSLAVNASGGSHVHLSGPAKGVDALRIVGAGTSRVDADALSADNADVTLKDAARAEIKATRSLTCDLQRASRLVVKGKPGKVDKKIAGVAKLELK